MRCYNCHEPGHKAKECTKPKVQSNRDGSAQANTERALVLVTASSSGSSKEGEKAMVAQQTGGFDWSDQIAELNQVTTENFQMHAFMTQISENPPPVDEVSTPSESLSIEDILENLKFKNSVLVREVEDIKYEKYQLKKENKLFSKQIEAQLKDIKQLKKDLSDKSCQLTDSQTIVD